MGIHGLAKVIADQAPSAIREQDIKNYFGKGCTVLLRDYDEVCLRDVT